MNTSMKGLADRERAKIKGNSSSLCTFPIGSKGHSGSFLLGSLFMARNAFVWFPELGMHLHITADSVINLDAKLGG